MTNLLLITLITVIIVDISGFPNSIKTGLSKWLNKNKSIISIKPFDCSFCMNFWISLIYLIIHKDVTINNIALVLVLSTLTPTMKDLINLTKDIMTKFINTIYDKIL